MLLLREGRRCRSALLAGAAEGCLHQAAHLLLTVQNKACLLEEDEEFGLVVGDFHRRWEGNGCGIRNGAAFVPLPAVVLRCIRVLSFSAQDRLSRRRQLVSSSEPSSCLVPVVAPLTCAVPPPTAQFGFGAGAFGI